ncbi:PDZ and LIM domain protein 2 [Clonorchis sinensis]|uniref:PDZ and LIM domain protein 2 n=2 Tax=Clonorchis sinensis TaxID=79923 RepID=G7Y9V3_CLOSI|nr:PDZ and LIM domain protein 2 [Clonorchis sinensis]GAA49737.1 PDZ and LIM domain protein 2 [Clonorchis sinensis]
MNIYFGSMATPPYAVHASAPRGTKPSLNQNSSNNVPLLKPQAALVALLSGQHSNEVEEQSHSPLDVILRRVSESNPWGFRIQGGSDYHLQLTVCKTQSGSPSEGVLYRGDAIIAINGETTRNLSHGEATEKIRSSGTELQMTIARKLREDFSDLRPKGPFKFSAPQYGKR